MVQRTVLLVLWVFFLKHILEKRGNRTIRRWEDTVFAMIAFSRLIIVGFVLWVFLFLNPAVGVFACVCSCLPSQFSVTLGRPAGLKQLPAVARRHLEPNIETCSATRQSHGICPLLVNKVRAIIINKKQDDCLRLCAQTKGNDSTWYIHLFELKTSVFPSMQTQCYSL